MGWCPTVLCQDGRNVKGNTFTELQTELRSQIYFNKNSHGIAGSGELIHLEYFLNYMSTYSCIFARFI